MFLILPEFSDRNSSSLLASLLEADRVPHENDGKYKG